MEPISEPTTTSPRISFSHDLPQSDPLASPPPNHHGAHVSDDSDFEFGFDLILAADFSPSPADDLFYDGKLLPRPPIPTPKPSPPLPSAPAALIRYGSLRELMTASDVDELGKAGKKPALKSFWGRLGRSSSLGSCRSSKAASMCPFPLLRSKSTGSSLAPSIRPRVNYSGNVVNNGKNNGRRIYSNGGNCYGIGVNPVLDVPSSGGMSFVSYLMCSCGSKSLRGGFPVPCSP